MIATGTILIQNISQVFIEFVRVLYKSVTEMAAK